MSKNNTSGVSQKGKINRRRRAKSRINNIEKILSDIKVQTNIFSFLKKYFMCEIASKEMVVGYKSAKKDPTEYDDVQMKVNVLKPAFRHYGLNVSDEVIKRLFSSDKESAKKLRDSLVHSMNAKIISKINKNYSQLNADMDIFLHEVFK